MPKLIYSRDTLAAAVLDGNEIRIAINALNVYLTHYPASMTEVDPARELLAHLRSEAPA